MTPAFPVSAIQTLEDVAENTLVRERLLAQVAGAFSFMALVLACLGLYGTLSFSVARRTLEIGIRMALGARFIDVVGMLLWEMGRPVALGVAFGLLAAGASANLLRGFLFGIGPLDALTTICATALLMSAAVVATYLPAQRAGRTVPVVALRQDES